MIPFFKRAREARRPRCAALVAAAGSASRMGGVDKQLTELDGVPVLVRTLLALENARRVDTIVVAAREDQLVEISRLCREYGITKCAKVVRGGENRVHSVLLAALEAGDAELLAVQDGARPLTTPQLIDEVIALAERCGAAAPAVPVKDTVKQVRSDGAVERTLDRSALRAVQTPQVFQADLLKAALQSALESGAAVTDDCGAVERLGKTVYLTEGDETNLKITTPADLILAEALLRAREERL
ncbi:2-C-methyl-D-erythritol 4-phosphate cytidylyltransferase [Dysosmobacter sp.]|uniref:2-C-methyl-D-erythritol 4-phosphate cytidylyltransferase n=1 Tax=Dysosmobacter sp. TaxID=2591382 RepID=UPI002A96AE96|nr:2-C-methyl-D-erythritol 4-phosphate cytidylyltransferase [Dysosmobacter sp.]MCI6055636.1 2-C-methyl-D-erythritol 4-phosphate cytidylyltransferase [Dysosmobacter sp.]MDY5509760.1 2-C-methyl-D-erythritol 4-phosphate cytidylyltransferase [Dysosmobacter sp.]